MSGEKVEFLKEDHSNNYYTIYTVATMYFKLFLYITMSRYIATETISKYVTLLFQLPLQACVLYKQ